MTALAQFHFLRPVALLAFIPALLLWHLHRRHADTTLRWHGVIAPALLERLVLPAARTGWLRPVDALLAVWAAAIIAIAGPSWELAPSPFAQDAPPVMIVLKVTPSMLAQDLAPSRLVRAQEKISDLLAQHRGQSAGLIAYSGSAHLVLPPTRDAAVMVEMARALAPDVMPRAGDDVSDAVALARRVLQDGGQGGSVLLLADDVAADQLARLKDVVGPVPVTILAMLPPRRTLSADLRRAAELLDARIMRVTLDTADVAAIGRRVVTVGRIVTVPGEAERWRDMGWFLVPLLTLVALLWFRRGWMVLE